MTPGTNGPLDRGAKWNAGINGFLSGKPLKGDVYVGPDGSRTEPMVRS